MSGGYVGVSVFFTLSGFLITSLALVEHDRTGRIDVGAFYARRVRRLLPASLVCLAGVIVAARLHQFDGITELRRDLWAAARPGLQLGAARQRRQLRRGDGQGGGSAVAARPLLVAGDRGAVLLGVAARPARPAAPSPGDAGSARSRRVWAAFVVVADGDRRRGRRRGRPYLATPARLPEILIGAVLAVAVHERPASRRRAAGWRCAGLVVIVGCAVSWPAAGGPAERWLAAAVRRCVGRPDRRAATGRRSSAAALSIAPLVWLGRISYGVYLFHWPIYTLVDERRLDARPGRAVRGAAGDHRSWWRPSSYYVIERPVRARPRALEAGRRRPPPGRALVVAGVVVVVPDRDGTYTSSPQQPARPRRSSRSPQARGAGSTQRPRAGAGGRRFDGGGDRRRADPVGGRRTPTRCR